jgi:Arylsulfotransferase (ASST)
VRRRANSARRLKRAWQKLVYVELFAVILLLVQVGVASARIAVFPVPGSRYNRPRTQITFRGVPAAQIGSVTVAGSQTGVHSGHFAADSDGDGASFLPDKPFAGGETVTVTSHLDIVGAGNGTFSFQIAQPWGLLPYGKLRVVSEGRGSLQHFRSRPDLQPAAVSVTENHAPATEGDIFVAPQFGPSQDGPMILDSQGRLVWFDPFPVSRNTLVTDFRVQQLEGQPVLTWWQGNTNAGHGRGEGVILDRHYQQIAAVKAGNGLDMGLHEFLLTPQGDAYIFAPSPVHLPGVGKPAVDSVVQEIDIKTGLVMFEWHALDHIPLSESYFTPRSPGHIFDPYHANSIALDGDGNLLVSMRNTSAVYEIDHRTGAVLWTLGGKHSNFRMGTGTSTWGQHDAIAQPDGTLTLFDDGAGPPRVHPFSRAIRESLDETRMSATLVHSYAHSPQLSANFEGSAQQLPDGDTFVDWGQQPYFSEYDAAGRQIFDAHFIAPSGSYRAYRSNWTAQPPTQPSLSVSPNADGATDLYASWNGATNVSSWRVLAGASPGALAPVGRSGKYGFETHIHAHSASPYFAVQAFDASGHALSTSAAEALPSHVAIYGRSAFVPSGSGVGGLPVGCFTSHPCHIKTSVWAGRTLIARTGSEYLAQNSGGLVYFRLSPTGRRLLARARTHRLAVRVTARDSSGARASVGLNLVPFYTAGRGPHRTLANSPTLRIVGLTDFVSNGRVGGILSACLSNTPCHAATTLSVGHTVIARTGTEFLGANELGYLMFTLTPAGRALLARAPGNQLNARVAIRAGNASATATIALVGFR